MADVVVVVLEEGAVVVLEVGVAEVVDVVDMEEEVDLGEVGVEGDQTDSGKGERRDDSVSERKLMREMYRRLGYFYCETFSYSILCENETVAKHMIILPVNVYGKGLFVRKLIT